MRKRIVRFLMAPLGFGVAGLVIFLFIFNRPLPVEVFRPAGDVPVTIFGLGTVEARILSKIGFEVGAALVELNADHGEQVTQGDVLARLHSAEQEARVARAKAGVDAGEAKRRAVELLDYLEVGHRRDAMPANLSGGEAQRVAIARALANRPRIILADEPTAALDSQRAGIVMDMLRKVASEHEAAILAVTHDGKIFGRFDHIFHLRDGRLDGNEEIAA